VSEGTDKPVRKNDTLSDVFGKIYNLLKINIEDNRKQHEIDKNFGKEKEDEREIRHKELLKALGGLTGGSGITVTKVEEKKKENSFCDVLKKIRDSMLKVLSLLSPLLEFAKDVGKSGLKMLGKLLGLLTKSGSKLFSAFSRIAGVGLSLALFSSNLNEGENEDLDEKQKMAPTISPGVRKQFSRNEIEQFVKHNEWFKDDELKNREAGFPGADRETLQQWLTDNPNPKALYLPDEKKDTQRAVDRSSRRIKASAEQQFGQKEMEGTGLASPVTQTMPAPAPEISLQQTPTATPTPPAPDRSSRRVQAAIAEQIQQDEIKAAKQSVTINSPKTVVGGDAKVQSLDVEESAPVRIDDPTLKYIQERNLRRF
jgi:hypothetical protein